MNQNKHPMNTNWRQRFDYTFPAVTELLPLAYREYLIEKGQTGVLFDIENAEREKRALLYHENVKAFIEGILASKAEAIRGKSLESVTLSHATYQKYGEEATKEMEEREVEAFNRGLDADAQLLHEDNG